MRRHPHIISIVAVALALGACATGTVVHLSDNQITDAKVVTLDAPVAPWVAQIELRLRKKGFKVQRIARTEKNAIDMTNNHYVLMLQGSHYTGAGNRCLGGGYKFQYLNAELIDVRTNESVVSISGEGYSEGCPPAAGTIFGDIADAVASKWERKGVN